MVIRFLFIRSSGFWLNWLDSVNFMHGNRHFVEITKKFKTHFRFEAQCPRQDTNNGGWAQSAKNINLELKHYKVNTFFNLWLKMERSQKNWSGQLYISGNLSLTWHHVTPLPFIPYSSIPHLHNSVFNRHWEYFKISKRPILKINPWSMPIKYLVTYYCIIRSNTIMCYPWCL